MKHAYLEDAAGAAAHLTPELQQAAALVDHHARSIAEGCALVGRIDDAVRWIEIAISRGLVTHPFFAHHDLLLANVPQDERWAPEGKAIVYRKLKQGVFVFARVATDGSFRVLADSLVTGLRRENRYLDNDDEHQRDLIPNGRDLLLARVLPPDTAAATPLRLILQEGAIPAPGGEAVSTAGDRLVSSFV